jgi:hypothetical protein
VISCGASAGSRNNDEEPAAGCCGSNNRMGYRFQSFEINDLEMVGQTSASWKQITEWLRRVNSVLLGV